jgi:hypothetical protein
MPKAYIRYLIDNLILREKNRRLRISTSQLCKEDKKIYQKRGG